MDIIHEGGGVGKQGDIIYRRGRGWETRGYNLPKGETLGNKGVHQCLSYGSYKKFSERLGGRGGWVALCDYSSEGQNP